MKYYKIHILKPEESSSKPVLEDNFRHSKRYIVAGGWFKASEKIQYLQKNKKKKFIENKLNDYTKSDLNRDYVFGKKETVKMITQGENNPVIFKGEINLPNHLRDKQKSLSDKEPKLGDMKSKTYG